MDLRLNFGDGGILRQAQQNKAKADQAAARIASGKAESTPLASQLEGEVRTLQQATRNAETGANLLRTAEGGLSVIGEMITRGRELSLQAANGALSAGQRGALQAELNSLTAEIDRVSRNTEFNGKNLLDGSLAPGAATQLDIQTGPNAGDRLNLNVIGNTSAEALGLTGLDLSTAAGATAAATKFAQAAERVNASHGQVGAAANRLDSIVRGLAVTTENIASAHANASDANLPEEVVKLRQNLTQIQASLQTLGLQLRERGKVTGLLLNTRA